VWRVACGVCGLWLLVVFVVFVVCLWFVVRACSLRLRAELLADRTSHITHTTHALPLPPPPPGRLRKAQSAKRPASPLPQAAPAQQRLLPAAGAWLTHYYQALPVDGGIRFGCPRPPAAAAL
jgi:hypothetical protein